MRKFAIVFGILLCAFDSYAENESAVTSREYVDAGISGKQDTLTTTGTNTVMTYDSSQSTGLGQKAIYDPSGDYVSQQDSLVTTATANAAVQNAINGEFECYEYNPNDPNDCWLVTISSTSRGNTSILPGDGEWFRAYFYDQNWFFYYDASSSIRIPIKPHITYRLYWDGGYQANIYRVAFTKTDDVPLGVSGQNMVVLYKSDGAEGAEFVTSSTSKPDYIFTVSDDNIKYIIIQINGDHAAWDNGDFSTLWDRISHLHLERLNWLPADQ
ncbi:MAG: hypothetical protein J6T57_03560 [Alphaproteobacteria bacterium]|nr:hypothetical protein [Alphaproteobacteria bacterium]